MLLMLHGLPCYLEGCLYHIKSCCCCHCCFTTVSINFRLLRNSFQLVMEYSGRMYSDFPVRHKILRGSLSMLTPLQSWP